MPNREMDTGNIYTAPKMANYIINLIRGHKRLTFLKIPKFGVWQAIILTLAGFVGGKPSFRIAKYI